MIKKSIKEVIKEYFFVNPTAKLRVRGIERELKLPLPSVIRYCKELEKEGILTVLKTGNVVFYTADRTSEKYFLEKRLYNIRQLYLSGLVDYIKKELSNPLIIVFGSYAKGEDVEKSDIDFYVESPAKKKIDLKKYRNILKREIQVFQYKNISEIKNIHLANNIVNGYTLNGFIEVFK